MLSTKKAHTCEIVPSTLVLERLNYILRHLDGYPFPRHIMTRRLGRQIEVTDKETALKEFELSNWQDCRISAYPPFIEYKGLNFTAPSMVFIDLDLNKFKDLKGLNRALTNTLKNISKTSEKSKPTVLWTGNGYHIYYPVSAFVLEEEQVFADFVTSDLDVSLSTKFMRFAEQYFTNDKQDPNHRPSVNNCLLRIPGTYNSKNGQRVRIVQEWNGYRVPIQYMLREFRRHLIQERIDKRLEQEERRQQQWQSKSIITMNESNDSKLCYCRMDRRSVKDPDKRSQKVLHLAHPGALSGQY